MAILITPATDEHDIIVSYPNMTDKEALYLLAEAADVVVDGETVFDD